MKSASTYAEPSTNQWTRRALHRVFSFPVMLAGMLAVLATLSVRERFYDPDMWWHLKTGEIISHTHTIPTTDLFSFTTNHHAYIPHEWLSQVLIYQAYRMGGYSGLMLWLCVLTSVILIAGYFLCTLYSGNAKVAFLGALIIWFFATIGLAIRPQMIGYLLLVVELLLIQLGQTRNSRWLLALPPLFAVWVNCHGSFFLGLIIAATFLFSSFFPLRMGSLVSPTWEPHVRRMLTLALLLSMAALFLNPIGVKQILYPLDTLLHQSIQLREVQEWQPLQISDSRGIGLLAVLAGISLLGFLRRSELFWHELLLLAMATWLAASHSRMLFVFGILAAPIVSRLLAASWEGYDPEQDRLWPNAAFLGISLIVCYWAFPARQDLANQVNLNSPAKAVDFIQSHHLSGPMLNEYVYGGYLIWAAPEDPVFIDGRGDVFEWTGVLQEFGNWATLQSDPATLLDKYGIQFCLLRSQSPMVHVLPMLPGWKIAYSDTSSIIFVRAAAKNSLQ